MQRSQHVNRLCPSTALFRSKGGGFDGTAVVHSGEGWAGRGDGPGRRAGSLYARRPRLPASAADWSARGDSRRGGADRKSTRLNSRHLGLSYAVFCFKKKAKL